MSARHRYQCKAAPTADVFLLKLNGVEKADGKNRKTADHLIQNVESRTNVRPVFAIEEGDFVAARINFSGTQLGQLINFPPTGKKLTADFNCFFRVTEGKIKESWVEYDNLNGLIQLGHYKIN